MRKDMGKSCGAEYVLGEVKFFCSTITGDLAEKWMWFGPIEPRSGAAPSTVTEPPWWNDPPIEGPAVRWVYADWDCCCDKPEDEQYKLEVLPSP
jgi:hypothetical protein